MKTQIITLLLIFFATIPLFAQEDTLLLNEAVRTFDQGDYKKADKQLTEYLRLHPNSTDAYFERAKCRVNLKKYKSALQDFDRCIKLDSTSTEAYNGRGMLLARKNHTEAALSDFNQALALDSLSCEALNNRGVYYLQQKEYQKALVDLLNAVRIGKKTNELQNYFYQNLSDAYYFLGQYEKALEAANKAIEMNQKIADGYLRRGDAYEKLGQQAEADNDYKTARKLEQQRVYNVH